LHGGEDTVRGLLGCCGVWRSGWMPTFRMTVLPPCSG